MNSSFAKEIQTKNNVLISLQQVNDSVSPLFMDPKNLTIEPRSNLNESKVTEFPSGILGDDASSNSTKTQPITPVPADSNTPSSSPLSSTPSTVPVMSH